MGVERAHILWGVIGVLLVGVFVVGEPVAEWRAERRLKAWVAATPWTADWRSLDWRWTGSLSVRGLEVAGPKGNRLTARRVSVPVVGPSLSAGEPRAGRISLIEVEVDVDVASGRGSDSDAGKGEKEGEPDTSKSGSMPRPEVCRIVDGIAVVRGRLVLRRAGDVVVEARGEGDWRCLGEGGARVEAQGRLERPEERGETDTRRQRVELEGKVHLADGSATGRLAFPGPEARRGFQYRMGPVRVRIGAARFAVRRAFERPVVEGTFEEVEAGVGDEASRVARLRAEELDVTRRANGTFQIGIGEPDISVAPVAFAREWTGRAATTGKGAGGSDQRTGKHADGERWRHLAYRLLRDVDVSVEGASVRLRVRDGDDWRTLEPSDSLSVRKRGRHLTVGGRFASGTARGHVYWTPGRLIPQSAGLQLREVDLSDVPVLRKGRSLPSRGIRGRVGGKLDLVASVAQIGTFSLFRRVRARTSVRLRNGWARADGLAQKRVEGVDADLRLQGVWHPAVGRADLEEAAFRYGPVQLDASGAVEGMPTAPVLDLQIDAEPFDCQRAVRSLPNALLGPYDDATLDGEATPTLEFHVPWKRPGELEFDLDGFPGSCSVTALHTDKSNWPEIRIGDPGIRSPPAAAKTDRRRVMAMPDPGDDEGLGGSAPELEPIPSTWSPDRPDDVFWLRKPFVKPVTEGVSEGADVEVGPGLASYVPLAAMPESVAAAAYLSEEINFYSDGAWNEHLIERALQMNFQEHRFVYGGSTVTQQLVKNLFLTRQKTLARKVQEALIAWRLQGVVSKDRVLELYLNCIEYGEDLYGIGPAAQHYFQTSARDLRPMEAVFLAAIKPAPWFGERFRSRGRTPENGWWRNRFEEIFDRLVDRGFLSREEADRARPYVLRWDDEGRAVHRKSESGDDGSGAEGAEGAPEPFIFPPVDDD